MVRRCHVTSPAQLAWALAVITLVLVSPAVAQTTWYVDDDTCPAMGDGSVGNPFCQLSDAIAAAVAGDVIEVAAGTYGPPPGLGLLVNVGQDITIAGAGADATIVSNGGAVNADPVFVVLASVTIRDLTIADGNKPSGNAGGIVTAIGTSLVERCRITNNVAGFGGGGAVVSSGTTTFRDCLIDGNEAQNGGGGGALVQSGGTAVFVNCTFADNSSTMSGGAIEAEGSAPVTMQNCIAWGDALPELAEATPGQITVTTAIIDGGWAGGTNVITSDPLFIDAMAGDYRLDASSPAVDAGDNAPAAPSTTDLDGNPRFVNDTGVADTGTGTPPIVDLGAYERQTPSGPPTLFVPSQYATIQAAIDAASSGDTIEVAAGTYPETLVTPLGKSLTIIGPDGADATIVDAGGLGRVLNIGADVTVEGLTLTGGLADFGGGVRVQGIGGTTLTMIAVRVTGNTATSVGGGIDQFAIGSSVELYNCLIDGNTAANGGGGISARSGEIVNCTIVGNNAPTGSAVSGIAPNAPDLTNSIVWGNTGGPAFNGSPPVVATSIVQGGEGGGTDTDPVFIDAGAGDYRLDRYSPAADAGDNAALPGGIVLDYDGLDRYLEDAGVADTGIGTAAPFVDLGPFERQEDSAPITFSVPGDFATIQSAADAAVSGDTIAIDPGTYSEAVLAIGKSLTLIGDPSNPASTVIDATGTGEAPLRCLGESAPSGPTVPVVVQGLTLRGGENIATAVLLDGNSILVEDCVIEDNMGTGLQIESDHLNDVIVRRCVIRNNVTQFNVGGVSIINIFGAAGTALVDSCWIIDNEGEFYGGMYTNGLLASGILANSVIAGNTGENHGGAGLVINWTAVNCTVVSNTADPDGSSGGLFLFDSSDNVRNCIVRGNTSPQIGANGTPDVEYSNVEGGIAGTGNFDADPLFVDAAMHDYRLLAFSPCVDEGDDASVPAGITVDLDGLPRFVDDAGVPDAGSSGSVIDVGAHERQDESIGAVITVPGDYGTIQSAVDAAVQGDTIAIDPGTYSEAVLAIGKSLTLIGDPSNPASTVIDATGTGEAPLRCLGESAPSGPTVPVVVQGLTLRGGENIATAVLLDGNSILVEDCVIEDNMGTGLQIESDHLNDVIVRRCVIRNNVTQFNVGGVSIINIFGAAGTALVDSCWIIDNEGEFYGGMYTNGLLASGILANSVIAGNTGENHGGAGLVINWTAVNCTVVSNTADPDGSSGGLFLFDSSDNVRNCIVRGNTSPQIGANGTPDVEYSNVEGGIAGTGNFDADPLFVDAAMHDYRLLAFSPCVDEGDDASVPAGITVDLDGLPRFVDGDLAGGTTVDVGAHELDPVLFAVVGNMTQGTSHPTAADAMLGAAYGDLVVGTSIAIDAALALDVPAGVTLRSLGGIAQSSGAAWSFGDLAILETAPGGALMLDGATTIGLLDDVRFVAGSMGLGASASLTLAAGATLDVEQDAAAVVLSGMVDLGPLAALTVEGDVTVAGPTTVGEFGLLAAGGALEVATALDLNGGSLAGTPGIGLGATATVTGYGSLYGHATNDGQVTALADLQVVGDLGNTATGTIDVLSGTLTVLGSLTNDGTITGDVSNLAGGSGPPPELMVYGDLVLGAASSFALSQPGSILRVTGNVDIAIDDNARLDLAQAELRLVGSGTQQLELLSVDLGPVFDGLDPMPAGHFPLGAVTLGPTGPTVELVDAHDNDGAGQAMSEAGYVSSLTIAPEATLLTNGLHLYYEFGTLDGTIDDPADVQEIDATPPCRGDTDGSGAVDIDDIVNVILDFGTDGSVNGGDVDGSGVVDIDDIVVVILNFGSCPGA